MEFIARIFVETAATMILLACVNGANIPSLDLASFDSPINLTVDDAPAIPNTYFMDLDSELVRF